MADPSEMQALAVVSSEIDESKWEVLMSVQCRKAQLHLLKHLSNEAANLKKECKYMSSNNSALDDEIKHAELEKMSLQSSLATITANRTETKYRYLIAKDKKLETLKRDENNIAKYEQLWLEKTKQFDRIPYVQRYHTTNNNTQILNTDINKLENEVDILHKMLKEKQEKIKIEDRNRIIELAKYMIEERPKVLAVMKNAQRIKPKTVDLKDKQVVPKVKVDEVNDKFNSDWSFIGSGNGKEDMVIMPELQATDDDLDSFSWNLDELKRRVDTLTSINKPTNSVQIPNLSQPKTLNEKESSLYNYLDTPDEPKKSYEQKKLIFILQDINLPKHDAENLVYGANPCDIKEIQNIGGNEDGAEKEQVQDEDQEEIEEVDMTPKSSQNLLQPPTQYMDMQSLENTRDEEMEVDNETSQKVEQNEMMIKNRRISFNLPTIEEVPERSETDQPEEDINTSQMETSGDETYNILKEMMLKKHQLDSSPDFTYAKNVAALKSSTEKPVTSKFFNEIESPNNKPKQIYPDIDQDDNPEQDEDNIEEKETDDNDNMEIDGNIAATPKEPDSQRYNGLLVSSVLFTHEARDMPHSLNLSINTTDDGEGDFPQCFDSSLLLSPKADVPISSDTAEVTSQDVPNFLTGLRKTGFSLFGMPSAGAQKVDTGVNSQNGAFNFNFGGDNTGEKKRGNFFSMFQ